MKRIPVLQRIREEIKDKDGNIDVTKLDERIDYALENPNGLATLNAKPEDCFLYSPIGGNKYYVPGVMDFNYWLDEQLTDIVKEVPTENILSARLADRANSALSEIQTFTEKDFREQYSKKHTTSFKLTAWGFSPLEENALKATYHIVQNPPISEKGGEHQAILDSINSLNSFPENTGEIYQIAINKKLFPMAIIRDFSKMHNQTVIKYFSELVQDYGHLMDKKGDCEFEYGEMKHLANFPFANEYLKGGFGGEFLRGQYAKVRDKKTRETLLSFFDFHDSKQ